MSKWMWIVAGSNGAGKSTATTEILKNLGVTDLKKLNADERTLELRKRFPDESTTSLNYLAANQIDAEVMASIDAGESFFVETVLSSPKYRKAVNKAKKNGYNIGLIYVSLHPPELSPMRISVRVAKGGHDVEEAKALARYHRSHEQLKWFAKKATTFIALDNSDPEGNLVLVAAKLAGKALVHHNEEVNPALDRVIYAIKKKKYPEAKVG